MGPHASSDYLNSDNPSSATNVMDFRGANGNRDSGKNKRNRSGIPRQAKEVVYCQVFECGAEKQFTCGKKNCGKLVCGAHGRAHGLHDKIVRWKNSEPITTNSAATEPIMSGGAVSSLAQQLNQAEAPAFVMNAETSSTVIVIGTCRVSFCSAEGRLTCNDCGVHPLCTTHGEEHSKHESLSILNVESI